MCKPAWIFVPDRSCTTQLLIAMDYWTKALEQRIPIDIVYLDFKELSTLFHIPVSSLNYKLMHGIGGKFYNNFGYVIILLEGNKGLY